MNNPYRLPLCDSCGSGHGHPHAADCMIAWSPQRVPVDVQQILPDLNPKDVVGRTKTPLRLIPPAAAAQVAQAFAVGAAKYGEYNWRSGPKLKRTVYLEAALRHIQADLDGETIDPETGYTSHAAHACAGLMILLDAVSLGQVEDDRPPKGMGPELMRLQAKGQEPPR
jgi:hypothetical protein